ncbi:MAG: hypothetical protein AAB225_09325 [Acidobacteriota bacterium]
MAERRGRPRLALKPLQRPGIPCRPGREELERDIAPQPGIGGPVNLAHAAAADRRNNPVRADLQSGGQLFRRSLWFLAGEHGRRHLQGRYFQEFRCLVVVHQQGLYLLPQQAVAGAGFVEEGGPSGRFQAQGGVTEFGNLSPSLRGHRVRFPPNCGIGARQKIFFHSMTILNCGLRYRG